MTIEKKRFSGRRKIGITESMGKRYPQLNGILAKRRHKGKAWHHRRARNFDEAIEIVRPVTSRQRNADGIDRADVGAAVTHRNHRTDVTAGFNDLREEKPSLCMRRKDEL